MPAHRSPVARGQRSRMKPWRAAETSATASGKSTRIASRRAIACSSTPPARLHLLERGGGELHRRVQRERRELLTLGLVHRLGLLLRELAQPLSRSSGSPPKKGNAPSLIAPNGYLLASVERHPVSGLDLADELLDRGLRGLHRRRERRRAPPGRARARAGAQRRRCRPAAPGVARFGGDPSACWSARAASSASSIPAGCSVIRSATSWARSSSRSPGKALSSAISQSAAIETASRTSRRSVTARTAVVQCEPGTIRRRCPRTRRVAADAVRRLRGEHCDERIAVCVACGGRGDALEIGGERSTVPG